MNPAQLHLALNHFPLFATLIGVGILGIGILKGNGALKKAGLWLFLIAAVSTVPVFKSGEPAEELVEHRTGVTKETIHAHEEAADFALIAVGLLGLASLVTLFLLKKGRTPQVVVLPGLLLLGIFVVVVMARTAHLGGLIRHDEIGSNATPTGEKE